jgi:hypothetical protein
MKKKKRKGDSLIILRIRRHELGVAYPMGLGGRVSIHFKGSRKKPKKEKKSGS